MILCFYVFWAGSASERRQSLRGSRNQVTAGGARTLGEDAQQPRVDHKVTIYIYVLVRVSFTCRVCLKRYSRSYMSGRGGEVCCGWISTHNVPTTALKEPSVHRGTARGHAHQCGPCRLCLAYAAAVHRRPWHLPIGICPQLGQGSGGTRATTRRAEHQ